MPRAQDSTDLSAAEEQTSSTATASPSAESQNSAHEEFKVEPHPEENGGQASPEPLPQDAPTLQAAPTLQPIDSRLAGQSPPKAEPEAFRRELPKVKLPKANLPVADPGAPNSPAVPPERSSGFTPPPANQPASVASDAGLALSGGPPQQADHPAPSGRFVFNSLPIDIDVKPEAVPPPVAPPREPLPKPPAAFAIPRPSPKRRSRAQGQFTPGFRTGMLRLTVLLCILVGLIGVGWYKHWFPWLDALHLNAPRKAAIASSAPTVAPKPGAAATAVPAPGAQSTTPAAATSASGTQPDQTAKAAGGSDSTASATVTPAPPSAALPSATGPASTPESNGGSDSSLPAAPMAQPVTKAKPAPAASATKHSPAHSSPPNSLNPTATSAQQGTFVPPKLIKSVPAIASLDDLRDFERGDVVIDALVDASGQVASMNVLSGPPSLRPRAMDALKNYKYAPATLNGQPVPAHVTVTVQFRYAQE